MQGCSFLLFLNYSYVLCAYVCVEYTVILEAAAAAATPTSSAAVAAAATVQHVLPAASFCYR